jgi:hypothetical protein
MTRSIIFPEIDASCLAAPPYLFNVERATGETMLSMERPNLSYTRREGAALRISEALRLAHQVEALLEEAAKDPNVDAYALRMAQGLARSLIVELGERPASEPRLTHAGLTETDPARVA